MRRLLNHRFVWTRPQFFDEVHTWTSLKKRIFSSENCELGVFFGAHRLDMDYLSTGFAEPIKKSLNTLNNRFNAWSMLLTPFLLHINNHESSGEFRNFSF